MTYTLAVPVPAELHSALPSSIDPGAVRAAVCAQGSALGFGGETWLLDLDGRLAVLSRASIFDALEPLGLSESGEPVILRNDAQLEIHPAEGAAFTVRPSLREGDAIRALLAAVEGLAGSGPVATPLGAAPDPRLSELVQADTLADPSASGSRSLNGLKQITLADLEIIDPDGELEVCAALQAGDYAQAKIGARKLAAQTSGREQVEWTDLLAVLELLRAGDYVAVSMWIQDVRQIPAGVQDLLLAQLSAELEAGGEPGLAWAAARAAFDEQLASVRCAALEAEHELDAPSLTRELAGRARGFFASAAEAGDALAQHGLAYALMVLDELDEALIWIRRANAGRSNFGGRMLEVEVLRLLAIGADDSELIATLQQIAAEFPDRPEPLIELAEQVEFDEPERAVSCLRQALEREFDEFVVLDLIELLEAQRRYGEIITELQAVLADPDGVSLVKDQLRDKLEHARAKLLVAQPEPSASTPASPALGGVLVLGLVLVVGLGLWMMLN